MMKRGILLLLSLYLTACASSPKPARPSAEDLFSIKPASRPTKADTQDDTQSVFFPFSEQTTATISLRPDTLSQNEANALFQSKSDYIKGLFAIHFEPYFGNADKNTDCIAGLDLAPKPIFTDDVQWIRYKVGATAEHVFGTCDPKREVLQSQIIFLYCKKTARFFSVKIFQPKNTEPLAIHADKICYFDFTILPSVGSK